MKKNLVFILICFLTINNIYGNLQDKNKILTDINSPVDSVRIKAVGIVIEHNIKEALPVLENDFEKQDISIMPLYLEALKRLGSARLEEKLNIYIDKIGSQSSAKGEILDASVRSKIQSGFINKIGISK
ncbi:MAG: hypothetical protein ACOYVE_08920 [Melioribacter sp.]|uniref:hypothetical protein n=1 Tax=Melioribacter sp. TaxID=2052167 RepID=UPI003BCF0596